MSDHPQPLPCTTGRIIHVLRKLTRAGGHPWATVVLTTDDTDRLFFDIGAREYRHVCDVIVEDTVVTVTSGPNVAGRPPRVHSLHAQQPTARGGADPYPLYETGHWFEVVEPLEHPEFDDVYCHASEELYLTRAAAEQALADIRAAFPDMLLEIRERTELWRARCVSCGESVDQEDYVYGSYAEVADLVAEVEHNDPGCFVWLGPQRLLCAGHPAASVRTSASPAQPGPDQTVLFGRC